MAAQSQPVMHQDDVGEWMGRVKDVVNKPAILTNPRPAGASKWHFDFFGCFDPVDTCLVTCCVPCVTFGKTHHRLRKDPSLREYNPVNASCVGFWVSSYFCMHWLPILMQRHDINEKFHLEGDCAADCLKAWCCGCCDLVQQDKEAEYRTLGSAPMVETAQPVVKETMTVTTEPAPTY